MATIGDLLSRLQVQVNGLRWSPEDTASAHEAGWIPLAKATAQAIRWLPLGGRSDQVKAGIRNVLAPLARGTSTSGEAAAATQLLELATTVGAISDSLAGIFRWGPRPEQIGTPALELEAELLASVHVVARWSSAAVEVECPAPPRPPLSMFLGDLIVVTEPYALISPQRRTSTLVELAFTVPSSPGLEGITAEWAQTASSILNDRFRVSGWAMQTIAANLALVSQAVQRPFALAETRAQVASDNVLEALKRAAHWWRRAAAWPPHLRLGGQNADLRLAARDLRDGATRGPVSSFAQARRLLGMAVPVGAAHVRSMGALLRKHELWIHAPVLVPQVPYQGGWIREPRWSAEGRQLLLSAETGLDALDGALTAIGGTNATGDSGGERPRWAPRSTRDLVRHAGEADSAPARREVGQSPLP